MTDGEVVADEASVDKAAQELTVQDWISYIKSAKYFSVAFDKTATKFNDEGWYGHPADPMGTLKGGLTYIVSYNEPSFSTTGYNEGADKTDRWTYSNANLNAGEISLWGRVFAFNGNGDVFDSQYGLVGRLYR